MFPQARPFDQVQGVAVCRPRVAQLLHMLNTPIYQIGSSATPRAGRTSHDYDVQIDQAAVEKYFHVTGGPAAKKALEKHLQQLGYQTRITGITVHFALPVADQTYQVDVEVVPDAANVHRLHVHDIPDNSPYKGTNKTQIMCKLARDKGLLYSPWQGLFRRDAVGKKADFITNDIHKIAQALLGPGAVPADLGSVESMLVKMPNAKDILLQMEKDPNWRTR